MKRLTLLLPLALAACAPQPADVASASAAPPAAPAVAVTPAPTPSGAMVPAQVEAPASVQPVAERMAPLVPAPAPRRITANDLKAAFDAGDAVIVDVRGDLAWQFARIDGSISIPLGDLFRRSVELPADKLIAFYCTCPAEESSGHAADELANIGFERSVALLGGLDAWRAAGHPIGGEGTAR